MNDTVDIAPKPNTLEAGAFNRERFARMRAEGKTPREIARELDYLPWYVYKQLRKYDNEQAARKAPGTTKGPH